MIIRLPSGDVNQAVGYMSLEFRGTSLGWRHTFPGSHHFLIFRAIIQDEITNGVSRVAEDEGLSFLGLTADSPLANFVPCSECYTMLLANGNWYARWNILCILGSILGTHSASH